MKNEYIVMKVSDLYRLINDIKNYEYCYIYANDDNRDGQGEWHCDIEMSDEKLDESSWGDGKEHWSFDSVENHMAKFGKRQAEVQNALLDMTRTSLSSSSDTTPDEPKHLQEHLELCGDMFDDFCREAQQFIDKVKE